MLLRISAPHFVAGVGVTDGKVDMTAPIVGYMHGWIVERVYTYCLKKGWTCEQVREWEPEKVVDSYGGTC